MKLLLSLLLLAPLAQAASVDLPNTTDGGSIGYATTGLYQRRGELVPPQELYELDELDKAARSETKAHAEALQRVKYHLLNGEARLARIQLVKLAAARSKMRPLIYRYLGILSFIDGEFARSYDYLNIPELRSTPHFARVCTLKVLNEVILNYKDVLEEDWSRCKIEASAHFKTSLIWLETLIDMKLKPYEGITSRPFKQLRLAGLENQELKLFLKLALYLNQEKLIVEALQELTLEQLQDQEVRELAGQVYFRTGQLARSYQFVEDLKSPNSENIKGNLYVLRNKYELAYAQFKLALEQKQNSQNALERLLPLAWLLGDWAGGSDYALRITPAPQMQMQKLTLRAAFLMQKGDFAEARNVLNVISEKSRRGTVVDVTQLYSFVSLMQNRRSETLKYADLSCSQYDLVNCWILFQVDQWGSFSTTARREDKITHQKNWETLTKERLDTPLKETVYVNQIDIEELDDKLIQLIPKENR